MSKENTQLGISNGPKNTLKLFSQDAFFFEANLTRKKKQQGDYWLLFDVQVCPRLLLKQKYKSTIKFVLTDRVKSDLRVSEQPDTAENSETKVKRWLIGRDHGKSTCDDNLVTW